MVWLSILVMSEGVKDEDMSRKHWTTLNRLRTGVVRYRASMKNWVRVGVMVILTVMVSPWLELMLG